MEHKIHGWNLFYVERLARAVKNAISERSLKSAFNFQSLQRQITGSRIKFFEDLHQTFFINFRDSLENYKKWKPNTTLPIAGHVIRVKLFWSTIYFIGEVS